MGEAAETYVDPIDVSEDQLAESKWFDYRLLPQDKATQLFKQEYVTLFREFYGKVFDYETRHTANPFPRGEEADTHCLDYARRAADIIGCRYSLYLRTAFWRFVGRGFSELPNTNQLYSEEVMLDVRDAWDATMAASIQYATSPIFLARNYTGSPLQVAYLDYLIGRIKRSAQPHLAIAGAVFEHKQLPVEIARHHFGGDLVSRASLWSL